VFAVNGDLTIQQAASERVSPLHQLRAVSDKFTGREAEINQILSKLRPQAGAVVSICGVVEGMPGVGKTELANYIGHKLVKDYPDAQLFIELSAHSLTPITSVQALTKCLRDFAPESKLPDDEVSLRNLYLSALQGKRALIILDDVRDDAHVAPLLPPSGCAAIITSRHALRTGIPLSLDVLPHAESIKLLCSFTERVGKYADTLAGLCGDLPIALTVAGGYLKQYISRPVDKYIDALQGLDRVQRLHNDQVQLDTLFDYSYRALTRAQQAAFYSLAVMPADFDRTAALAVIGADDAGADSLDELVALNLLQYDAKSQRFRWHDLLRNFARSRATPQALDAATDRHSAHFMVVLSQAKVLYKQGNASIVRGLALYDQEAANIQAGQAWAASHASQEVAAQRCIDYANAGVYVLDLRLHPRERIRWLEAQLAAARKLHHKDYEGNALGNLGSAYADLGNVRKAIEYHEQALVIDREISDRRGEGRDLSNQGSAYYRLGEARKAIDFYEQALVILREIGDRRGEGQDLDNMGLAYAALGDARKAISFYEQALEIDREIGDRSSAGHVLNNLGNAYAALSEARKAIDFYEQVLVILHEIGDRRGEGNALGNLGSAYFSLGDARKAIDFYEQQLKIAREIGDRHGEGTSLGNLGLAYHSLGEARKAIDFYEQALVITREIGDRHGEGNALGNLGSAYADLGDTRKAIDFYEQALVILHETGDRRGQGNALGNLGSVFTDLGDVRKAIDFYEQRLVIAREIDDRLGEGNALGDLGSAYYRLGDARKAIDFYEQALVILHEIGDRRNEGNASWNLGLVYEMQADFARAIPLMQVLVDYEREIGHPDAEKYAQHFEELRAKLARKGDD
jgi:tetratricopeptide (TPR) repeat protein